MNWKSFRQHVGHTVRIRPVAIRDHARLPSVDDEWLVSACRDQPTRLIELQNLRTGHFVSLGTDNVHEYRSPGFLMLKCQVFINDNRRGPGVELEPLPDPRASR